MPLAQLPKRMSYQSGKRLILFALGLIALVGAALDARWIVLITWIGIGLGVMLIPILRFFKRTLHIPRFFGAMISFLLIVGSIGGLFWLVLAVIQKQIAPLLRSLPAHLSGARNQVSNLLRDFPEAQRAVLDWDPGAFIHAAIDRLFSGLQLGASALGAFLFILTISLYVAISPREYMEGLLSALPSRHRARAKRILEESAFHLRRWFFSQLLAAAIVGLLTGLALALIGIPGWSALGLLTAGVDLVPYLGPLVAAAATAVVTLATRPEQILWVLLAFIVMQHVESEIVVPLIMKERMQLPPVHLLTFMLFLGYWFGLVGIFVAPPLFAVIRGILLHERSSSRAPPEIESQRGTKKI